MKLCSRIVKKALPHYIHHRNYIGRGGAEATTIRQIVQVVALIAIAYRNIPLWLSVLMGIALLAIYWAIGWVWDKNNGNDLEADWSNVRNPAMRKLLKRKL